MHAFMHAIIHPGIHFDKQPVLLTCLVSADLSITWSDIPGSIKPYKEQLQVLLVCKG